MKMDWAAARELGAPDFCMEGFSPPWRTFRRNEMAHVGGEGGVKIDVRQAEGLTLRQT